MLPILPDFNPGKDFDDFEIRRRSGNILVLAAMASRWRARLISALRSNDNHKNLSLRFDDPPHRGLSHFQWRGQDDLLERAQTDSEFQIRYSESVPEFQKLKRSWP